MYIRDLVFDPQIYTPLYYLLYTPKFVNDINVTHKKSVHIYECGYIFGDMEIILIFVWMVIMVRINLSDWKKIR